MLTDHHKAVPELRDRVRLYGLEGNCRGVDAIAWFVDDMVLDPSAVARDTAAKVRQVLETTGAETVVIGCTIVSACYELAALDDPELSAVSVINPNVMAVKVAEMFADLRASGQYRMSRTGYYQRHEDHDRAQAADVLARLTDHEAMATLAPAARS